jgi:cytochrome c oxidase assembly protein subunit 15
VRRIYNWLPDRVDGRLRALAWIYLAAQILLVGTGGLVRLTDSGLGCPTWPQCTPGSFVNTPQMGIHGYIEFGNRVLGILLGLLAVVAFLFVIRMWKSRRDFFWLTLLAGIGIPAQAVLGGLSVLTKLNPYVVGLHFILSVVLVAICTVFVYRVYTRPGERRLAVARWYAIVTHVTSFFVAVTIILGILTTGSGPHAGDAHSARNGLNPEILQHLHSFPAYAVFVLTLVLVFVPRRLIAAAPDADLRVRRFAVYLLIVEFFQIAIGLIQANTGLPGILVGIHEMLAAILASAMVAVVLNLKTPVASPLSVRESDRTAGAVGR